MIQRGAVDSDVRLPWEGRRQRSSAAAVARLLAMSSPARIQIYGRRSVFPPPPPTPHPSLVVDTQGHPSTLCHPGYHLRMRDRDRDGSTNGMPAAVFVVGSVARPAPPPLAVPIATTHSGRFCRGLATRRSLLHALPDADPSPPHGCANGHGDTLQVATGQPHISLRSRDHPREGGGLSCRPCLWGSLLTKAQEADD